MNTRSQLLCAWSGPAFVVFFTVGFWFVAHYLPPPSPTAGAQEIAALYREHTSQIRLGMLLMMACSALIAPFVAAIAVQMKRMETGTPVDLCPVVERHGGHGIFHSSCDDMDDGSFSAGAR